MTSTNDFDRDISAWFHADAEHRVSPHLDAVLRRTRSERQRPAWSSLERWLPMQSTARLAPVPRMAWLLVVLGLVLAIGAMAVLAVGSRSRQPAPPFGLARNGSIVYGQDGDILRFDPSTGTTSAIVAGATDDLAPMFSRDGTAFAFLRSTDGAQHDFTAFVANADGTDVHAVSAALRDQTWWDWSPDGSRLAIVSDVSGIGKVTVANADGSGSSTLNVGMPVEFASWRSDDEILFRGQRPTAPTESAGLFVINADGTGLRQVVPTLGDSGGAYQRPIVSGDGSKVAYTTFERDDTFQPGPTWDGMLLRLHVLDLATGTDRVIPIAADPIDQTLPTDEWSGTFSSDGRLIAFLRDASDDRLEIVVAPADGSAVGKRVGPATAKDAAGNGPSFDFSPDATAIIATYPRDRLTRILPIDGSASSTVPLDGTDVPTWQRQAP